MKSLFSPLRSLSQLMTSVGGRKVNRRDNSRSRHGRRSTFLRVESLEDRRMLATFYVDDTLQITTDTGASGLTAGDTVTFRAGPGSATNPSTVPNLTFGTNAFNSIQAAVNAAAATAETNDVIIVGPGNFTESVNVNTQVTLRGNQAGVDAQSTSRVGSRETVVSGPNGQTAFNVTANNVVIDGFTVQGATNPNQFGFGILLGGGTTGQRVQNNIVQNNIVGIGLGSANTIISNNLIINNNAAGPAGGTGIYSDEFVANGALTNVTITENTISGNANAGVVISPSTSANAASNITIFCNTLNSNGTAVVLINTQNSSVTHNEIHFSEDAAIALDGGNSNITVKNNVIADGGAQGILISNTPFFSTGANSNVTINQNSISGNAGAGLQVDSGAYIGALNAESNWWGAASGPTISTNAGGTGQAILIPSSGVSLDITPFLTSGVDADPEDCGFQVVLVSADLSVTKTVSSTTVSPGGTLTYTVVVKNNSTTNAAQNVSVTESLPAGLTLLSTSAPGWSTTAVGEPIAVTATRPELAAGAQATLTFTVKVDQNIPIGTQLNNSVTVSASTSDANTANNTATTITNVVQVQPPVALECEVTTDQVPGVSRSAQINGDVLVVTGTPGNDTITIDRLNNNRIRVRIGSFERIFDQNVQAQSFNQVVVFGQNGNDRITVSSSLNIDTVLLGGSGNDTITAGSGNDQIDGGSGNDSINAGGGNDIVCGGSGNDTINGGAGNDFIGGDEGNDRSLGDSGDDILLGGSGNDNLDGGSGDDLLFGQDGNDSLTGGIGSDVLLGGSGNDQLNGGVGSDVLIGGRGSDTLKGGANNDILIGGATNLDEDVNALNGLLDALLADDEDLIDEVLGNLSDDQAADSLFGEAGSDLFFFGKRDSVRDKSTSERGKKDRDDDEHDDRD